MITPVLSSERQAYAPKRSRVAESRRRPVHVARLVDRLHRRNHAELREARDVGVIEHLHVLDAKTVIDRRDRFERRFIRVERDAVAAIADRVRSDLEAVLERARRNVAQVLGRGLEQPGILGIVGVGIEERRAARAERAVGVELDGPNPEVAVVERALRARAGSSARSPRCRRRSWRRRGG